MATGAGRVGGDAAVEDLAGGDVDEERQVATAQQGCVDGREVTRNGVWVPKMWSCALTRHDALAF